MGVRGLAPIRVENVSVADLAMVWLALLLSSQGHVTHGTCLSYDMLMGLRITKNPFPYSEEQVYL